MEESKVSFEVAKLLKDIGFSGECSSRFDLFENELFLPKCHCHPEDEKCDCGAIEELKEWNRGMLRPTQSLAQKWLREVHNVDVYCIPWVYENKTVYDFFINYEGESRAYSSYEKALEEGLKQACLILKEKLDEKSNN